MKQIYPAFRLARIPIRIWPSGDGKRLILMDRDGLLTVWDVTSRMDETDTFSGAFANYVKYVVPGRLSVKVGKVELNVFDETASLSGQGVMGTITLRQWRIGYGALSSTGDLAATGSNSEVRVWDTRNGDPLTPILPITASISSYLKCVGFDESNRLIVISEDGKSQSWS